jgi:hypothetical protein
VQFGTECPFRQYSILHLLEPSPESLKRVLIVWDLHNHKSTFIDAAEARHGLLEPVCSAEYQLPIRPFPHFAGTNLYSSLLEKRIDSK